MYMCMFQNSHVEKYSPCGDDGPGMNAYEHVLPKGNGTYIQYTCTRSNLTHECVNELTLWIR